MRHHSNNHSTPYLAPASNFQSRSQPNLYHDSSYAGSATCTFSAIGSNAVVVLPPSYAADSRPLYRISVETNVLNASMPVTTIRRGGSEHAPVVGETKLTGNALDGVITMGSHTEKLRKAVQWKWAPFRKDRVAEMDWKFNKVRLYWEPAIVSGSKDVMFKCFTGGRTKSSRTHVATIHPAGDARREQELVITASKGNLDEALLDHIVVSSLVFQCGQENGRRKREQGKFAKSAEGFGAVADIVSLFGN